MDRSPAVTSQAAPKERAPQVSNDEPLIVPLPEDAWVITRWPIPVVVKPSAPVFLSLMVLLGWAFGFLNGIAGGHNRPSLGDVALGVAVAMLFPVALILHEVGHALAGIAVGRPPVWAQAGVPPFAVLTPPPAERWARILVSGSGPLVEVVFGLLLITISGHDPGRLQFPIGDMQLRTGPWTIIGALCLLDAAVNLAPGFKNTDGGKLWREAWGMAASALRRNRSHQTD